MISKHLGAKIILSVLVGYMAVTLVISAVQLTIQYTESRDDVFRTLKSAGTVMSRNITLAVYTYDDKLMQETLRGLVSFDEVYGVTVTRLNGDFVAAIGIAPNEEGVLLEYRYDSEELLSEEYYKKNPKAVKLNLIPNLLKAEYEEDPDDGTLLVTLYTTESFIQKRINSAIFALVLNTATQILTLAFILVILLKFQVSRPLAKLEEAARAISPDNEEHSFETTIIQESSLMERQDELGSLAHNMEVMRVALDRRDKQIRDYAENLEKKVEDRTRELRIKNMEITTLIDNMPVGIMTIEGAQVIGSNYSPEVLNIFDVKAGTKIDGREFVEFLNKISNLTGDTKSQVLSALGMLLGENQLTFEMNKHVLPKVGEVEGQSDRKHLEFSWAPIKDDEGDIEKILFCARDVSLVKELQMRSEANQDRVDIVSRILDIGIDRFKSQVEGANDLLEKTLDEFKKLGDNLEKIGTNEFDGELLFRYLHTMKGNSRTMGCKRLANCVHDMESLLSQGDPRSIKLDVFQEMKENIEAGVDQVNQIFNGVYESFKKNETDETLSVERCRLIYDFTKELEQDSSANRGEIVEALNLAINPHYSPISDLLTISVKDAQKNCRDIGKGELQVVFEPKDIVLPRSHGSVLGDVFNHLLTNSVTHGIPDPSDPHYHDPRISIEPILKQEKILIKIRDNGKGLNLAALRKKAQELNLPDWEKMSSLQLADLIFQSGMSTAQKVTNLAGRGVGMDAVRAFIEQAGGEIYIEASEQQPIEDFLAFSFNLSLPIDLSTHMDHEQAV